MVDTKTAFELYKRRIAPYIEEYDAAVEFALGMSRAPDREWMGALAIVFETWHDYQVNARLFWADCEAAWRQAWAEEDGRH